MITLESSVLVPGITGSEITEFLLSPTDDRYQAWWPDTHIQLHVIAPADRHVGEVVWMYEHIGSRRLRMAGVVLDAAPGRRIVWQLKRWIRLPAWVRLEVEDRADGCLVRHTVEVGYRGFGRVLDPMLRLYLSPRFAAELDEHVHTEFPKLRDHLHRVMAWRGGLPLDAGPSPSRGMTDPRKVASSGAASRDLGPYERGRCKPQDDVEPDCG